jgi:hypothetical protein
MARHRYSWAIRRNGNLLITDHKRGVLGRESTTYEFPADLKKSEIPVGMEWMLRYARRRGFQRVRVRDLSAGNRFVVARRGGTR